MAKKTIVICSSGSFYQHVNEIAEDLKKLGFRVIVPATAAMMKKSGDFDISKVKSWYHNPAHFKIKRKKVDGHFQEVTKGDAILIVNDDKPNQPAYIGPNAFMEWGLAHWLAKPVYILNSVSRNSNYYEEAYGMGAVVIDGDLSKIKL